MEDFSDIYNQYKDAFEDAFEDVDDDQLVDFLVKTNIQYKETRPNYKIVLAIPMHNVKSIRIVHLDISNIQIGIEDYGLYIHITDPHTNDTYNIHIDIPNGQNMTETNLVNYIKQQIIQLTPPSFQITFTHDPITHFITIDAYKQDYAYQIDAFSSTTWNAFGYPNYNNGVTSKILIDSYAYIGEKISTLPNYHVIYHPSAPITSYQPTITTFVTSGYYLGVQNLDKFQTDLLFYNTSITTTPTKLLFGTTTSGLSLYNIGYTVQIGQTLYTGMNNYEPSASMGITTYDLLTDHVFMRTLNNFWVVGSTAATGSTMYVLGISHANILASPLTWSTTMRLASGITTFTQLDISPHTNISSMFFMAYANSNSITGSGVASYATTVLTPFKNFMGGIQHVKFGGTQSLIVDGSTFSMLYTINGVTILAQPFYTTSILQSIAAPNGQYISIATKKGMDIYRRFRSTNGWIPNYHVGDIINDMEWYGDRLYTTNQGGNINLFDMTPRIQQSIDIYHPSAISITCSSALAQRLYWGTTAPNTTNNYSTSSITTNILRYYIGLSHGTLLCFTSAVNATNIKGVSFASSLITAMDGDHTNLNRQLLVGELFNTRQMPVNTFTTATMIHSRRIYNSFFSSVGVSQLNIRLTPPHLLQVGDTIGFIPDANILGVTTGGITTSIIFSGVTYIGINVPELTVTSTYTLGATVQWFLPNNNLLFIDQPMTDIPPFFGGITETWLSGFSIGGGSTVPILSYQLSATYTQPIDIPELVMKFNQADNTVANDISGKKIDNTLAIIYGTSEYIHNPIIYNNNLALLTDFSIGFTTIDPTYQLSNNLVHDVTFEIIQVHTLPARSMYNTNNNRIENPDSIYTRRID